MTCINFPELSAASKMTLKHQGGIMSAEEASAFECLPNFDIILLCREWDEKAKVANMENMTSIMHFKEMFKKYMLSLALGTRS
jgi:predicted HD phosphohydrolase